MYNGNRIGLTIYVFDSSNQKNIRIFNSRIHKIVSHVKIVYSLPVH